MRSSKSILQVLAGVVAISAMIVTSTANAAYPCKSVEWIVGWGAGGGSDRFARSIAPGVGDGLGVPVKVINMKGASSVVAQQEVMSRPADGCTLFSVTPDQLTNEITGLTELSYKGLQAIMRAHVDIGMILSKKGGDIESWSDVVDKAKGGGLLFGGTGAGSFDEIVANVVMGSAGIKFRYIPYESASEMHADLLGGRLNVIYEEASVMAGMIDAGQVQPLLVLAKKRLDRFSSVPSAKELGYRVPPALWRGVAVKAGTDKKTVKMLEDAFITAANTDAYKEFEAGRLLDLYPGRLGASKFQELLADEWDMYKGVIDSMKKN